MTRPHLITGAVLALSLLAACSMLGRKQPFPEARTTSGVGPFRVLEQAEIGIETDPGNAVLDAPAGTVVSQPDEAGGFFFFDLADALADPPDRADDLPDYAVDYARFGVRRIMRAASNSAEGFGDAEMVLEASEAWEGASVFGPSVCRAGDEVRMYYAGEQGIGLAVASSEGGAFSRVGTAPVLEDIGDGVPTNPGCLVDERFGSFVYFEADGALYVAETTDGRTFETPREVEVAFPPLPPGADAGPDAEAPEIAFGSPAAVVGAMGSGRQTVRLYFHAEREDETLIISMAGSEDGLNFQRYGGTTVPADLVREPSPTIDDDGITRLYHARSLSEGGRRVNVLQVGVDPSGTELPIALPPESTE